MLPKLLTLALIVGASCAVVCPARADALRDAVGAANIVSNEFNGEQINAVLTAWTAVQASDPSVPSLASMRITYATDGRSTTVSFWAPMREGVRDGLRYIEVGNNLFQVSITGADVRVYLPGDP